MHQAAKEERQRKQAMDEHMKRQMNKQQKQIVNDTVAQSKMNALQKQKQVALETKAEKMAVKQRNLEQRQNEEMRARNMRSMIHAQKAQAAQQREIDQLTRQQRTRFQIEEKLAREAEEQAAYEADVQRMEREELELINRLKNTKLLEEAAHNELEGALTDPNPGQRLEQTQSQFSGRGGRSKPSSRGGRRV